MQQVVQGRKSAKQRFGQITPPDVGMSEFTPSKSTAGETAETEAAERARTDKSERARNAANQRHAKTKKIGNDSQANNSVDCCDDEGKAGDEKKKYREKNGLAASKCRAKKKENIKDVEAKHHKLGAMNFSLKSKCRIFAASSRVCVPMRSATKTATTRFRGTTSTRPRRSP